ncbi:MULTISPECIES: hypothetical protein [Neisseria]|jgi:hypothetical protein|uniref:Uncharacterized protein n=1 Tax=Neisseria macacae ATCC 33926 TaxID=997348 RepID=A0ABY3YBI4_9NEIS|nr:MULTISPECIES: hypothetical protein [Neisseria]UNV86165.1 hypothetical protein MON40_06700 [Neisseria macacae ATCC 33926]
MLKILNNSLNGITLGQRKVDLDDATLDESSCSLEFDRKHKIQSDSQVITLSSSETCDEFSLNGKIINFSNLEKFVEEENPLVEISDEEKYFYTFPQYNLVLYVDYKDKLFLQVLIYDESIKDLYENSGQKYSDFQKSKLKSLITFYGKLIFIPYKSVGNLEFNSSLSDIIKEYDILEKIIPDKKNILWINNFALRFDNEKLTQITIFYDKKEIIPIYYNEINISSEKGLSELLNKYDGIERGKSKYLFKELGLVVAKDFSEFHFFEQSLLKFWANLHRAITSW